MAPRYSLDIPDFDTYSPGMLGDQIDYAARFNEIDPELAYAVISQESSFNPSATSPAGAKGMMQVMPGTAGDLGIADPYDTEQSLMGGLGYLNQRLKANNGSVPLALASYNAGQGPVDEYGGIPPYPETQGYVKSISDKLGVPLPQMPALAMSSSRGSAQEVAPVSKLRTNAYDQITSEIEGLQNTKADALGRINNTGRVEDNDAIAMALTAILPALLGLGFGGMEGAAIGAQAGAAGADVGLKGIQANQNAANETNRLIYNDANQRLSQRENQQFQTRSSMAATEEQADRDERLYGAGGIRRGSTAATQSFGERGADIYARKLAGEHTSREEDAYLSSLPGGAAALARAVNTASLGGRRDAMTDQGQQKVNLSERGVDLREKRNNVLERQGDTANALRQQGVDNSWKLGNRRADIQEKQGDARLAQGDRRLSQTDERNAAYAEMVKNNNDRAKERIALSDRLAGKLPPHDLRAITGKDLMLQNYQELAGLVAGRGEDFDPERVGQALGEVLDQYRGREDEPFSAAEWSGLFNRFASTYGIDPNSYNFQVLQRMEQIGRANAIAQPGVATNQDALSETNFVRIRPGQTVDAYLENLTLQGEQKKRELSTTLKGLDMNGYGYAKPFMQKYGIESDNLGQPGAVGTPPAGGGGLVDTGQRDEKGRRIMRAQ